MLIGFLLLVFVRNLVVRGLLAFKCACVCVLSFFFVALVRIRVFWKVRVRFEFQRLKGLGDSRALAKQPGWASS